MNANLQLMTAAAAILISIPSLAIADQAYLPPQQTASILADGTPWSASAPNGRTFKLTLNKDGTGSISGALPIAMSTNWAIKGEAFCLSNTMMSKCLRYSKIPGGLQGWDGNKPDLKLSR